MVHFKVEHQSTSDLYTNYPHDPADIQASIQDYLEYMLSQGWEFAGSWDMSGSESRFIFRCVGRDE